MKKPVAFLQSFAVAVLLCLFPAPPDASAGAYVPEDGMFIGQTNYVSETFVSNLPLIILETPDTEIVPGSQTGTPAVMRAVETQSGNRPDGESRFSAGVTIDAIRYENDVPRPKKDYFITVTDGTGGAPLTGLDPGERWFLLGGAYDKSLIRNYLGYTMAKRVLDSAPDVRLCELILKNSAGYEYQGVYLLVEGGDGGEVTARRTEHYWEGFNQTVVANGDAGVFVFLDNWGGGTEVASMGGAIDSVSAMFASQDTNYYLQYGDIIDTESFCAYFLVNEIMANYDGMSESVYSFDVKSQKISIGPIWNFECALDNQKDVAIDLRRLMYQTAPFYSHMIIDSEFVTGLINVSKENAAELSGTELCRLIELAVSELGAAQERDWYRWQYFYLSGENALSAYVPEGEDERIGSNGIGYTEDGALLARTDAYYILPEGAPERIRQFETYEQEIVKLKFYANERPAFVRKAILLFKNQGELLTEVNAYGKNSVWAVLFLVGFIVTIILARKTAER